VHREFATLFKHVPNSGTAQLFGFAHGVHAAHASVSYTLTPTESCCQCLMGGVGKPSACWQCTGSMATEPMFTRNSNTGRLRARLTELQAAHEFIVPDRCGAVASQCRGVLSLTPESVVEGGGCCCC
jgi:hypothetical protein